MSARAKTKKRILGLDPASIATGWALIEEGPELVDAGTIRLSSRRSLDERLLEFKSKLSGFLETLLPDKVIAESPYVFRMSAAIALYQVRALILSVCSDHSIPLEFTEAKAARAKVLGNGAATKEEVQDHVYSLFGVRLEEDASDAACIALSAFKDEEA